MMRAARVRRPAGTTCWCSISTISAQAGIAGSRLAALGHLPVEAENPYWTEHGAVTVEDPDGWRVVLMPHPSAG